MATARKKPLAELFSDKSLRIDLPTKIGKEWEELLIRLGLSGVDIDHINHDNDQLKDKIKNGLVMWNSKKEAETERKRAEGLLEALRAVERVDLKEKLEDEYDFDENVQGTPDIRKTSSDKPADNSRDTSQIDINMDSLERKGDNSSEESIQNGPDINGDFPLRNYQMEIAHDGLKGENSIILAETGSGKTRVAVYIMKNHLDNNHIGRIAFFNTTLTLLDQQYEVLCKFLPKYKHQIMKFSGTDKVSETVLTSMEDFRVCVLTPMTLEKYLADETVSLSMFTLLVFDECHHTRKNEPYKQIMTYYRKLLRQNSAVKLPQILGLTASVGTERASNVDDAKKSILELMARMNVYKIATPRINREEYTQYVPDPKTDYEVLKERRMDPIKDTIEGAMEQFERWLRTKLLDKEVHTLLEEIPDDKRMYQQYQSWLSRLKNALGHSKDITADVKRKAIEVAEHLTMYQTALEANEILSMNDVLEHLYRSSLRDKTLTGESYNTVTISKSSHKNKDAGNSGGEEACMDETRSEPMDVDSAGSAATDLCNTGSADTGLSNTGIADTGLSNIGSADTGLSSTGSADTSHDNTGSADTGLSNTGSADTDIDNTGSADTGQGNMGSEDKDLKISVVDGRGMDNAGNEEANVTNVSLLKDVIESLESLSKDTKNENPNIIRLREMVDENFKEKGEDSTFIVFVETRESAIAVSKYLRQKSSFAKCCFLISSQTTDDAHGSQSQADHKRIVNRLRLKHINGLVATKVAEEGLDIRTCNFVIRYNTSSNEISTAQAAGRCRAIDGSVIVFANQRKVQQEQENVTRLNLMKQALEMVLDQPGDVIQLEVDSRIKSIITQEVKEERSREASRKEKKQEDFTLRCWKCSKVAVSSCDIRCYKNTNYIVIGEEFYRNATRRLNKKAKCYDNMRTTYKIYCSKCNRDWGVGNCMGNLFFAVLKITQFTVRDDDTGKEYNGVPWSKLPYTVQTMDEEDFPSLAHLEELIQEAPDNK